MRKPRKKRKNYYPALSPHSNPQIRKDFIDIDYIDKLSEKEKEWLNKFMDEYNGANLNFKDLKKNLHKTKALKKDCTDRVNSRNRDIYAKARSRGELYYMSSEAYNTAGGDNPEEALIDLLHDLDESRIKEACSYPVDEESE